MRRTLVLIAVVCTVMLGAGFQPVAAAELPPAMLNVTWELVSMQAAGQQVENTTGTGLTIVFAGNGTFSGSGGCNQFTGKYVVANEGTMGFSAIASTLRACADPAVDSREMRYFATLREVAGFVLDSQTSMRLTFAQQGLQLVYRRGAPTLPATGLGGMAPDAGAGWPLAAVVLVGVLIAAGALRTSRRPWRP